MQMPSREARESLGRALREAYAGKLPWLDDLAREAGYVRLPVELDGDVSSRRGLAPELLECKPAGKIDGPDRTHFRPAPIRREQVLFHIFHAEGLLLTLGAGRITWLHDLTVQYTQTRFVDEPTGQPLFKAGLGFCRH